MLKSCNVVRRRESALDSQGIGCTLPASYSAERALNFARSHSSLRGGRASSDGVPKCFDELRCAAISQAVGWRRRDQGFVVGHGSLRYILYLLGGEKPQPRPSVEPQGVPPPSHSFSSISSTLRNSTGWLSDWSEIVPPVSILGLAGVEQALAVGVVGVELRLGVLDHGLAVDFVADELVAVDFDFDGDPLVAVVGVGRAVGAVLRVELAVRRRRWCRACRGWRWGGACGRRRRGTGLRCETGKSWSLRIDSGDWPWIMTPLLRRAQAGPPGPARRRSGTRRGGCSSRTACCRTGGRSGRRTGRVLVVADLQDAVLDAEGVGEVVAGVEAFDFWRPAVEVLAVEELDPLAGGLGGQAQVDRPEQSQGRQDGGRREQLAIHGGRWFGEIRDPRPIRSDQCVLPIT